MTGPDTRPWTAAATLISIATFALPLACSAPDGDAGRTWPGNRPIQIVCFTNPGGDTDVISRIVAQAMEPILGTRINVVNKPGAHGGLAMRDIWSRTHDGYRWGGFSSNILIAPVMGGHHTTAKDWTYLIVGGSPGVISVAADSPHHTLESLVRAAKERPGRINAGASTTGGVWHVQLVVFEREAGAAFNFVPYEGSHPSQLALLSGEVEVVLTSLAEQAELIKSGRLRPLAAIQQEAADVPGFDPIPSISEWYPAAAEAPVSQWLGFGLPRGLPGGIREAIENAFLDAMESETVSRALESRLMTKFGWTGAEADRRALESERVWSWTLAEMGIAELSPEELGIDRP